MPPVRLELMWQAVLDAVAAAPEGPLDVLDLGGGTGGDAVRLAQLGHRITVVDSSPDALASLHRRASEAGVERAVTALPGDTADLSGRIPDASIDLVLCHGVLEYVDDPEVALSAVPGVLRPGGLLSVLVAGRLAAVVARAVVGDFESAARLERGTAATWDLKVDGPRRYVASEIDDLIEALRLRVIRRVGRRTFADLVPSALVDADPAQREALMLLERQVEETTEFTALSGGLQTLACLDLGMRSPTGGNRATV